MIKKVVKDLLPRRLLPRLLLIFLVPLIIIQCSVIFFFYDRHWEKIITRFSNIASNQIDFIISNYNNKGYENAQNSALRLNLQFSRVEQYKIQVKTKTFFERKIEKEIKNRLGNDFFLTFEKNTINIFKNNIKSIRI